MIERLQVIERLSVSSLLKGILVYKPF